VESALTDVTYAKIISELFESVIRTIFGYMNRSTGYSHPLRADTGMPIHNREILISYSENLTFRKSYKGGPNGGV